MTRFAEKRPNISLNNYLDLCDYVIFRKAESFFENLRKKGDNMCYGTKAALTIVPGILIRDSAYGTLKLMQNNDKRGRDAYHRHTTTSDRYSDTAKILAGITAIGLAGFGFIATGGIGALVAVGTGLGSLGAFTTATLTAGAYAAGTYIAGIAAYAPLVCLSAIAGSVLKGGVPGFLTSMPTAFANIGTGFGRAQEARDEKLAAAGKDLMIIQGERNAAEALRTIENLPEPVRDTLIASLCKKFTNAVEKAQADVVTVKVAVKPTKKREL